MSWIVSNTVGDGTEKTVTVPSDTKAVVFQSDGGDTPMRTTATTGDAFTFYDGTPYYFKERLGGDVFYATIPSGATLQMMYRTTSGC
jgi:hypothetical protein